MEDKVGTIIIMHNVLCSLGVALTAQTKLAEEADGALGITMLIILPVMLTYGVVIVIDALSWPAHFRIIHHRQ